MGKIKRVEPRTLSGFMELLPKEQLKFNKMLDTIRRVYEQFGFLPIDTPIVELAEVLLAKAGGETEKQIYHLKKGDNDLVLRFDLTVSFAKYVAKNYYSLKFPFKRYQIGKVYRGERAQKGRFREFYQADIDIIGDGELSIINDAEIPNIIYHVFKEIGLKDFIIKINNRKLISGLLETFGLSNNTQDIMRIMDKLRKIGIEKVKDELKALGIKDKVVAQIVDFMILKGTSDEIIENLQKITSDSLIYREGLEELVTIIKYLRSFGINERYFAIDLSITRGLDYYTGTVYETFIVGHEDFGSICSGGRYDDLATYYIDKKLPGVGISIGVTRLFDLLVSNNLLPEVEVKPFDILVIPMDENKTYAAKVASYLMSEGISNQIYYEDKNLKSKINYANQLGIPYMIFCGEDERNKKMVTIKNLATREQQMIKVEEVSTWIKK
ncbi:MAG: histidine--tRNA ligase [Bacilli bacterium]